MRYAWDWHAEYLLEHGITSAGALAAASMVMNQIRTWDYTASKRVDLWIANSETVATRIQKFYGHPSKIIYPPVDTDFFSPAESLPKRAQPYAITVSRLSRYKRINLIIEACAKQQLPLVIVGDGDDADYLRRLAQGKNVEFTGPIDDKQLRNYLQHAQCYLTAVEEDFGIAPVEALSMGIPVVALKAGGVGETVENGRTGILFDTPELESVCSALQRLKLLQTSSTAIRNSALRFSKQEFHSQISQTVDHA